MDCIDLPFDRFVRVASRVRGLLGHLAHQLARFVVPDALVDYRAPAARLAHELPPPRVPEAVGGTGARFAVVSAAERPVSKP